MPGIFLILALLFLPACGSTTAYKGQLGYSEERRVIIVGENVRAEIARYYQKKYDGLVWFTPATMGTAANAANNLLESGVGASRAMRALIGELRSINYTVRRWQIIVPGLAEKYFYHALKNMETGALAKARGTVVLIDSAGSPDMEREVRRVTGGSFFVAYEFRKDLAQ